MTVSHPCEGCDARIQASDLDALGDAFIDHVRAAHPDWPYPDVAIRNYAEATQRLATVEGRVAELGAVEVHPVTDERLGDWLAFFDRDAFAGNPAWAACYCTEPHTLPRGTPPEGAEFRTWRENRALATELLSAGGCTGYLAYVDGRPAGWVNASVRSAYSRYRLGADRAATDPDGPEDDRVVGVSCFIVAPPYRRHGLAATLLERVIADAPGRGAGWIEAYPAAGDDGDGGDAQTGFLGRRALYETYGFTEVRTEGRQIVMRRPVP